MKTSRLMQHMLRVAGVGAAAMVVAGVSGEALAQTLTIKDTKHNLTNTNSTDNWNRITTGTNTEICVFCHTPHGANTDVKAPIWNKATPAGTNFTTYASTGSSTLDAATVVTGSVSLACLSCHDGTQAMDNMINKPGSGGYNGAGSNFVAGTSWAGANQTDGKMTGVAAVGSGNDLSNDHPIGIVYCGGYDTSNVCVDTDFKAPTRIGTFNNADAKYYVETNIVPGKDKTDMILYTRDFAGANRGSVECASCHDPHVAPKGAAGEQVAFLRVSQASSGLCLSCHDK